MWTSCVAWFQMEKKPELDAAFHTVQLIKRTKAQNFGNVTYTPA